MTRFANQMLAVVAAVMITATSFAAVTSTPLQPQLAVASAPVLA
ncbi:hypothetical protein [Aurantiacibacter aquimixticola]|nr:hypothetical protein [Aurantiacibacter aquimixticola]